MICDTIVNTFMVSIENPALTSIAKVIAPIFDPIVLIVLSLIVASYIYIKFSKARGIIFGGIMALTGGVIVLTKEIVGRARPLNMLIPEFSYSFPSGHATIAIVFLGLLVYLFVNKKYKVQGIVVASLLVLMIGVSRIYLRVHWVTDVLGGFVIGGVILGIGIIILKRTS